MKKEQQKKYYLDKESYDNLLYQNEKLEEELRQLNYQRGEAHKKGTGVAWDGAEFSTLEARINVVKDQLNRNLNIINSAILIENKNTDGTIDIGDILRLNIIYSKDDSEEFIGKLVGFASKTNGEYEEISVNGPVGAAIYGKNIGETISYNVAGRSYNVEILERIKEKVKTRKREK